MPSFTYKALRVHEISENQVERSITSCTLDDLPPGEVLVRVHYSSLNYKDALSATGNRGVTRHYPHTPGIDAAGVVEESSDARYQRGDEVIVTSYDLGMNTPGGFGQYIRVPADWVVPRPQGLSLYESMILGTAGFTAALALHKMEQNGQHPDQGPVLVTGATGGVGSSAVALLAKAGYQPIASTGKQDLHAYLEALGATEIISREAVDEPLRKPMLSSRWAGAIDSVGGSTLGTAIRACAPNGNVATCGLVGSPNLSVTVFPFIIRGVNLLGVESAECPMPLRLQIWQKLATTWRIDHLSQIAHLCSLDHLNGYIDLMLQGKTRGRIVVDLR
ncbi:putative quinone oxidoreductase, YhdH/YhfP family [Catalinimonas alkaloidigena]|uniref:Putative quinone oxidoreductase, YhdH/YhfP family n=1 Tax=Catalinimonas alkaloidigena TaxID=1075417 RepID=A0A1G8X9V8_9BACT|nr:YhdH/YhfP family quinone oxidoreductase [Catalinimonas alkaloidigena]SDJ86645.1 putative quinone oxidoreductase, YhdH/YhfP family [Catalinimonas alkaloidigena]